MFGEHIDPGEVLRAAAEQRRADYGEPRSMPGPMREVLKREVASEYRGDHGAARGSRKESDLHLPWPLIVRLAGAFCLVAIVIGVPTWLRKEFVAETSAERTKKAEITQPASSSDAQTEAKAVAPRDEATEIADAVKEVSARQTALGTVRSADPSRKAPAALAAAAPAEPATAQPAAGVGSASGAIWSPRESLAASSELSAVAGASARQESPKLTNKSELERQIHLSFENVVGAKNEDADGRRAKTTNAPLQNFEVQIDGDRVAVVDADGSLYRGRVEPEHTAFALEQTGGYGVDPLVTSEPFFRNRTAKDGATDTHPLSFRFRATGENRTLQKSIVFEGTLHLEDEEQSRTHGEGAPLPRRALKARLVPSARVYGNARINGGNAVLVEAIPAETPAAPYPPILNQP